MSVEVCIKIGHKACKNLKPTTEGHTHNWTVFVQGANDNEIKHIVDKVIFHLPDVYSDPKQIKEKPPFVLSGSTSESFSMQIDIFFCAGAEPNKVCYIYELSMGNEEVNSPWEERLIFKNPSEDFKKKLLLAGGKVVEASKTFKLSGAVSKCEVESEEEIEIIKEIDKEEALNSVVEKIDNLQELLKENENLKAANREVIEKTIHQEKLLSYYEKKLSSCETTILSANMGIRELKIKMETDEKEISTLKSQMQMLQNELSLIRNTAIKNSEEKDKGMKRKRTMKKDLDISAPAEKKREVIQATKVSSSIDGFNAEQSSSTSTDFSVSIEKQKSNKRLSTKRKATCIQTSSNSKTDTARNNSSEALSESPSHHQSNNEIQLVYSSLDASKTDDVKSVGGKSVNVNSKNASEIRKNSVKPLEGSPNKINSSINKSKTENNIKRSEEVNANFSKNISKIANSSDKKSVNVNSSKNTSKIANNSVKKSVNVNSPKNTSAIVNNSVKKSVEGSPNKVNISMNKSELKNSSVKSTNHSSMEVDSTLCIPEKRNNTEKGDKKNSVAVNNSPNKPEKIESEKSKIVGYVGKNIKKGRSSAKTDASIVKNDTKNLSEKNVKGSSAKIQIIDSDTSKAVEGIACEATVTNDVKLIARNSSETETAISKVCPETGPKDLVKEPQVSSIETDVKSSDLDDKENDQKLTSCNDDTLSLTLSNTDSLEKEKNTKSKIVNLPKSRKIFQRRKLNSISVLCSSVQDVNFTRTPIMQLIFDHYQPLSAEFNRIKNSEFQKFKYKTNPLFYKLKDIEKNITEKYFLRYVRSVTDFFTNPKMSYDMATVVYFIVHYLCCSRIEHSSFTSFIHNQDAYAFLPKGENCIISAMYEIENNPFTRFNGLIRNTLDVIHRVIVSKKRMSVNGLASLCRAFMEICRRNNNRSEPIFLCWELLRFRHPLGPYLINVLVSFWRDPFYLHSGFVGDEKVLLDSIGFGMKVKPLLINSYIWNLSCRLTSTNFPPLDFIDPQEAIHFLIDDIISRCNEGLFEKVWILTSSLVILILNESWDWKMYFRNEYIVPNLLRFARCLNEKAFIIFCNLYVDICSFCLESPFEELQQFFTNSGYEGESFLQDCAAIAMLKYIITTDGHIPAPLKFWFLSNKSNPKLSFINDLYCKKVMESQEKLFLWEDVIIL